MLLNSQKFSTLRFYETPPRGFYTETQIAICADKRNALLLPLADIFYDSNLSWPKKYRKGATYLRDLPNNILNTKADAIARSFNLMLCVSDQRSIHKFIELEQFLLLCRWSVKPANMREIFTFMLNCRVNMVQEVNLDRILLNNVRQAAISTMNWNQKRKLAQDGIDKTLPSNKIFSYDWLATPWTMAKRKGIYMWQGRAYLHTFVALDAVREKFTRNLKKIIKQTINMENSQALDRAKRVSVLMQNKSPYSKRSNGVITISQSDNLWKIDNISLAPKPPCIQMLFSRAKVCGHIGYKGRLTLLLWLKNIGISKETALYECIKLLYNANHKELTNSIQDIWKKSSMKSIGCIKMQNWPKPSHKLETHGCPVRYRKNVTNACRSCSNELVVGDIEDIIKSPVEWTKRSILLKLQ